MDKEQIEKAASEAQEEMAKRFIQDENFQPTFINAFKSGADWRINSVWHDASEEPIKGKYMWLALCKGEKVLVYEGWHSAFSWSVYAPMLGIIMWAYVEDLIPERKEAEQ